MELEKLTSAVEAILFSSDRPVPLARIVEALEPEEKISEEELAAAVEKIKEKYLDVTHGLELREAQGGFHFCTKAENAVWVRRFLAAKPFRLSRSALETLSIIAYRQPITRAEIDRVRGIDCSHLLRALIEKGLVKMAGKADVPGRPVQYATTPKFLETAGLNTLSELPPLSELEQLQGNTEEPERSFEEEISQFTDEKLTPLERAETINEGLQEIENLIGSVGKADKDIYESTLHSEIAQENESALASRRAHPNRQLTGYR